MTAPTQPRLTLPNHMLRYYPDDIRLIEGSSIELLTDPTELARLTGTHGGEGTQPFVQLGKYGPLFGVGHLSMADLLIYSQAVRDMWVSNNLARYCRLYTVNRRLYEELIDSGLFR